MKSPHAAGALAVFPLILSVLGVVLSMNKASILKISLTATGQGNTFTMNQVTAIGNRQERFISFTATLNGNPQPMPFPFLSYTTVTFKNACPSVNFSESCYDPSADPSGSQQPPADGTQVCVPSSAWALIIVNQFFSSVAIILQAAVAFALCVGKGSRILHHTLSVIAIIALLISVSAVMAVPSRFYVMCWLKGPFGTLANELPNSSLSASFVFDAGGQLLPPAPRNHLFIACAVADDFFSHAPAIFNAPANFVHDRKSPAAGCRCWAVRCILQYVL